SVDYEPGESTTGLFGGNSNWRGPIWFPVNYLVIEALRRYARYFGDSFTVEHPTGSGQERTLGEVADELAGRLVSIFLDDAGGRPAPPRPSPDRSTSRPPWPGATPSPATGTTPVSCPGSTTSTSRWCGGRPDWPATGSWTSKRPTEASGG